MAIPITKKIKLNLNKIKNKTARELAKEEISEYIVDTILDRVSKEQSPVKGGKWSPLTESYKEVKSKISGSTKANMELFGDMLDDLDARFTGNTLSVGFHKDASDESKLKAENHNKFTKRSKIKVQRGSKSGRGGQYKVPERNFIPKKSQNFESDIISDINSIIESYADED